MSKPDQPTGMFATPYGVEVPVFDSDDPAIPGGVLFSASSAAICAGIHDPAQRKRFVADANRSGEIPLFQAAEYGGFCPVLRIPLPRPAEPAYLSVPAEGPATDDGASCREIVDRWVDRVTLHVRWRDRAEELLGLAVGQIDTLRGSGAPAFVVGFPVSIIITSVLENLGDQEVDCIEAAAFYALSSHDEWRKAGLDWLTPLEKTWWADWTRQRQGYRRLAKLMLSVYDDLPRWLAGRSA